MMKVDFLLNLTGKVDPIIMKDYFIQMIKD